MSKIGDKVKKMIVNWLNIQPSPITTVMLNEQLPFQLKAIESKIWYRGDAFELDQFYKQIQTNKINGARFWSAETSASTRKVHTGLPATIVDTLAYIVKRDIDKVKFKNKDAENKWKEICKNEHFDFDDIIGAGIIGALSTGDGAWKIVANKKISDVPIVEFYSAERVEYEIKHGVICGIDFITDVSHKRKVLKLKEKYRKGKVTYELWDNDRLLGEEELEKIADVYDIDYHEKGNFSMAIPFKIYDNPQYPNRGKSIFKDKIDDFDAFDEVVSQWLHAYRQGRVQKYIPENLIPRKKHDGTLKPHNPFDNEYITVDAVISETGSSDQIQVVQPEIWYEAYESGYIHFLDMCLHGIISPATLGIDLGKMSSADAQREKKDVTGITRNNITGRLEKVLPCLISAIIKTYDIMKNKAIKDYEVEVTFGEYGAPDFDSRVETVGKAATNNTMSIETQVRELWGSSKDEDWIEKEVQRIKNERGIETVDEPKVGEDFDI